MKFDINRMSASSDEAAEVFGRTPEIVADNAYFNDFQNFFPLVFNVPTKSDVTVKIALFLKQKSYLNFRLLNRFRLMTKLVQQTRQFGDPIVKNLKILPFYLVYHYAIRNN